MERHLQNILKLVDDNLIVKVVGILPNLQQFLSEKYQLSTTEFKEVLFVELDKNNFENLLASWKKSNSKTKLVLYSRLPHNLFPEFPTYSIAKKIVPEIRYSSHELIDLIYRIDNSTIEGDFLIYAPKSSLQSIQDKLKSHNRSTERSPERSLERSTERSLERSPERSPERSYNRKIIVTSSLSDTNFGCIFDTILEDRLVPTVTGGAKVRTRYISKRDAELRSLGGDIVYRMISSKNFNNLLDVPEARNIPLHHIMIDNYKHNIKSDLFDEKIFKLFLKYGIIDYNFKVTKKGNLLRKMPFGLRNSILCLENMNYESIVLASCIENFREDIFLGSNLGAVYYEINTPEVNSPEEVDYEINPPEEVNSQEEVYYEINPPKVNSLNLEEVDYEINSLKHLRNFNIYRGSSDVETLLNVFVATNKVFINKDYLQDVNNSIDKICKILDIRRKDFNVKEYLNSVDEFIKDLYIDSKLLLDLEPTIYTRYMDIGGDLYSIDSLSINTIETERPLEVYGIILSSLDNLKNISLSYV